MRKRNIEIEVAEGDEEAEQLTEQGFIIVGMCVRKGGKVTYLLARKIKVEQLDSEWAKSLALLVGE